MSLPALAPRHPGTPQPAVETLSTRDHTEADWESMRKLIKQLYIEDNRKLSETMAILQKKYSFAATEQMYKKRLKKWNIRKRSYRKSQPLVTSSTPSSSESADAEPTSGPDEPDELGRPQPPSNTTTDSLILVQPSALEPYAGLEIVLGNVFSWTQSKLETHCVTSDPMSKYLADPGQPPIQDSRTMYRTFELVFDLWRRGKGDLAGMAARKGFYVLEYVLTDDHPDLVWHMLDTIHDMVDSGHLQLLGMFLEHAVVLARSKLPAQHPLLQILSQLKRCDYQTEEGRMHVCHVLRQAWLRNVDVLGEQIGSMAPHHLWLYEQLIWDGRTRLRKNSDLQRRREQMYGALRQLADSHDPAVDDADSTRLRVEALMLEFTQMDLGDKSRAEQMALQLLGHHADSAGAARSNARFHAYAHKMLARLYEDRREWEAAEANLRLAIDQRVAAHGTRNNIRVVRDMWVLAKLFDKAGRPAEAEMVAQDAINRATEYLNDLPG